MLVTRQDIALRARSRGNAHAQTSFWGGRGGRKPTAITSTFPNTMRRWSCRRSRSSATRTRTASRSRWSTTFWTRPPDSRAGGSKAHQMGGRL